MPYIIITQDNRGEETLEYVGQGDSTATMPSGKILYRCADVAALISQLNEIDAAWESSVQFNPTKI